MSKQPEFTWDEVSGICGCSIVLDNYLHGFGIAQCADIDRDMLSERTGAHIAESRAQINLLQNYKNNVLRPGLQALKHLRSTMTQSKKHNSESYERKRLNIEIRNYEKDIADIQQAIELQKQMLHTYIHNKDIIYQRIRANDHEGYKESDTETLQKDIDLYNETIKAEAN